MPNLMTFSTVGVLALVGTAVGLHLGHSSVSEINPRYFQEPATRFHSDLSAYRSPAAATYSASHDMATPLQLGTGCVGCRTYPEEYYPERDPLVDQVIEGLDEPAVVQAAVVQTAPDADMLRRQADLDRLHRYASYAVSSDERVEAVAETPAEAGGDEASAIQGDEVAARE